MKERLNELRAAIREKHGTAHAFCRANPGLKRSTVYLVLSGKYPGNQERQAVKILEALAGGEAQDAIASRVAEQGRLCLPPRFFEDVHDILQGAKCAHCRRLDKRGCPECNTQTEREAQALEQYLLSREGRTHE